MDENKIYELLEKICIDVQDTKNKVEALLDEHKYNAEHISYIYNKMDSMQNRVNSLTDKTDRNKRKII